MTDRRRPALRGRVRTLALALATLVLPALLLARAPQQPPPAGGGGKEKAPQPVADKGLNVRGTLTAADPPDKGRPGFRARVYPGPASPPLQGIPTA